MLFISWTALLLLHDGDHLGPGGFGGGGCSEKSNKSERMSLLLCVFLDSVLFWVVAAFMDLNNISHLIDRYCKVCVEPLTSHIHHPAASCTLQSPTPAWS